MTDKKSLSNEMDCYAYYLTDSTQRIAITVFAARVRTLENDNAAFKVGRDVRIKIINDDLLIQNELKAGLKKHTCKMGEKKLLADRLHAWYYHTEGDTDMEMLEDEVRTMQAELNQCLTAHAMLNDKVCALETENNEAQGKFEEINGMLAAWRHECAKLKAENESLKDKIAINTLAFNVSLKEIKRLKADKSRLKADRDLARRMIGIDTVLFVEFEYERDRLKAENTELKSQLQARLSDGSGNT